MKIVKLHCYFLIYTLIGLSLTSCGQQQSFPEIDRTFTNNRAIAELNSNLQTSDVTNNNIPASPNSGKFDRTTKLSPEESAIVLGIFGFQLICYLLVRKFRGQEEANRMLRRSRRRVK
ncbi:MAG: hypothetical protein HC849_24270 [Oscillatoriales cyanobacterium RU_3_3]|nr:hypothetical protein [Microcoleus sp. SM1_3_4]NJM62609.1 hypothetical protein [Oscillatoriales cyanobacterium RU_3_3]NJR26598.1 hypothetical protein [Richelia sp. CSU_2_1]